MRVVLDTCILKLASFPAENNASALIFELACACLIEAWASPATLEEYADVLGARARRLASTNATASPSVIVFLRFSRCARASAVESLNRMTLPSTMAVACMTPAYAKKYADTSAKHQMGATLLRGVMADVAPRPREGVITSRPRAVSRRSRSLRRP